MNLADHGGLIISVRGCMTDEKETPETLRAEIEHLRRLAGGVTDERVLHEIRLMIEELERRVRELEQRKAMGGQPGTPDPPGNPPVPPDDPQQAPPREEPPPPIPVPPIEPPPLPQQV